MRRLARLAFAVLLAFLASPAMAQDEDYATSLRILQALDQRVQDIGWRLARGNVQFCSQTQQSIGLLLQDIPSYNRPTAARGVLGIATDFAVQTAAQGSPAQHAGLTKNQPVVAIDGHNVSEMVENAKAPFLRLQWAMRAVQMGLDTNGSVSLKAIGTPDPVAIAGESVCKAQFTVRPNNDKAAADARSVYIGGRFPGLAYADDELAAAIAHEMAHVVLRHPQWLSANGRKRSDTRETEREADRLMPWLLANAGYEPDAAVRFMRKWGPKHGGGLLRKRTHDGWDERVEFIEAELPLIQAALVQSSSADWSAHFAPKPVS